MSRRPAKSLTKVAKRSTSDVSKPRKITSKSRKNSEKTQALTSPSTPVAPTISRRSLHRKSTIKSGRVIGESREKLETASERLEAHRKIHRRQVSRVVFSLLGIALVCAGFIACGMLFLGGGGELITTSVSTVVPYAPTIPIEDQDAGVGGDQITSRMREYIGMVEADLREYGLTPTRAVIPSGAIREIDFYLDGYTGYIKTTVDRGAGVTAEDTDRMLRYLVEQGITEFEYIDVRLDRLAYWK